MTIDPADVSAWQTVLEHTYGTTKLSTVVVADGYGLQVTIRNGQLNIIDGVGTHRRHRTITRADRVVKRLVILGRSGTVSLDALRWCNALEIGVSIIDGDDVTATTTPTPKDARLRRSQALAAQTAPGNRIAAHLIGSKITGQASLLADLGCDDDSRTLTHYAAHIARWDGHDRSMTLDRLREIEALCASLYFTRYTKLVRVLFATREQSKVPTHWTSGVTRKSQLTNHGSPRKAADPLNALLNYSYALAESTSNSRVSSSD